MPLAPLVHKPVKEVPIGSSRTSILLCVEFLSSHSPTSPLPTLLPLGPMASFRPTEAPSSTRSSVESCTPIVASKAMMLLANILDHSYEHASRSTTGRRPHTVLEQGNFEHNRERCFLLGSPRECVMQTAIKLILLTNKRLQQRAQSM